MGLGKFQFAANLLSVGVDLYNELNVALMDKEVTVDEAIAMANDVVANLGFSDKSVLTTSEKTADIIDKINESVRLFSERLQEMTDDREITIGEILNLIKDVVEEAGLGEFVIFDKDEEDSGE
jgi:hypothetical protein